MQIIGPFRRLGLDITPTSETRVFRIEQLRDTIRLKFMYFLVCLLFVAVAVTVEGARLCRAVFVPEPVAESAEGSAVGEDVAVLIQP